MNMYQHHINLNLLLDIVLDCSKLDHHLASWNLKNNQVARYYLEHILISNLLLSLHKSLDSVFCSELVLLLQSRSLTKNELKNWFEIKAPDSFVSLKEVGGRTLFSLE